MTTRTPKNLLRIVALALLLGQQGVFALLTFDGTRNQVFFFGNVSYSYDSNLYADASGRDDSSMSGSIGAEFQRRAGIIAVDASVSLTILRFQDFSIENADNPAFSLSLTKTTGRMTGSLSFQAFRESRSDTAVNLRTSSWNYPVTFDLKYPINERYYVTSNTHYNDQQYIDNEQLYNHREWSEAIDLFYVYTSKLDLSAGYRIRMGETSLGRTADHNFYVGATGGLLPKLSGTVRFGYQNRQDDTTGKSYDSLSAFAQVTWTASRKFSVVGSLSRDFETAADGSSVDTSSASLNADYTFTRRFHGTMGLGIGRNRFVSEAPPQREDEYFTWNLGAIYTLNDHLKLSATYTYFKNWSNVATADYDRDVLTLDLSARY